jgi:hypothetical protein
MFRTTLHSVLLMAVAFSQILGGVSCCCLGRSLSASFQSDSSNRVSSAVPSEAVKLNRVQCPKCQTQIRSEHGFACPDSAPDDSASNSASNSAMVLEQGLHACNDGQCNCTKLVLNASKSNSADSIPERPIEWVYSLSLASPMFFHPSGWRISKFEAPLRFGGRCWQTIAGVWKN